MRVTTKINDCQREGSIWQRVVPQQRQEGEKKIRMSRANKATTKAHTLDQERRLKKNQGQQCKERARGERQKEMQTLTHVSKIENGIGSHILTLGTLCKVRWASVHGTLNLIKQSTHVAVLKWKLCVAQRSEDVASQCHTLKNSTSCQHDVQNDTARPNIRNETIVSLFCQHFRSDIVGCTFRKHEREKQDSAREAALSPRHPYTPHVVFNSLSCCRADKPKSMILRLSLESRSKFSGFKSR